MVIHIECNEENDIRFFLIHNSQKRTEQLLPKRGLKVSVILTSIPECWVASTMPCFIARA